MQPARRILTFSSRGSNGSVRTPAPSTCLTCRARPTQRRAFSRSVPRHAAPSAPSPNGIARLTSRKLISVSGPDATKYLQGVITANIYPGSAHPGNNEHLRSDAGFYAAFLTAQGRVLHDVFLYHDVRDRSHPRGHSWLVEVDAAEAERLQKHIRRYKLRAKFDVRVLDDAEAAVWHLWSDADDQKLSTAITQHVHSPSYKTPAITTRDPRAPGLGHRVVLFGDGNQPATDITALGPPDPFPLLDESFYRLRRYLYGISEGQAELAYGQALPHESNMDFTGAIDFRKGCYVGQELTIRTEHRGVVRKRVLPVLLYPEDQPLPILSGGVGVGGLEEEVGLLLGRLYKPQIGNGNGDVAGSGTVVDAGMVPTEASIGRVGKKGRSAGKWLSGVGNVGLALCRLEIMTDVVLPGETGGVGFSEGDEFVVGLDGEDGRRVKIKAFVPEWLRRRLAGKEGH
ncbi:Aminomethyltransferase folate-binding domain-containing protein [Parathielavia appendiculata]|uniref:Iron-sulfur cluster assembly factor IBA57 homolog, mitochondrial n=1 Tax=Parathielavia appendiculata TaxID=2587402 RepID=A0AAN6Z2W4_9PEZI|nr:Aminomethyltransferase folate-binding domain-containing protein [Parathielavia appendiculata]